LVVGDGRKKVAEERGSAVTVAVLPLVRIWVRREAAPPSVGGVERCLWGLQGLKTRWGKKEGREMLAGTGNENFLHSWSMKITYIYRWRKRDTFSLLVPNFGPWFDPKALQPLLQSNDELLVLYRKMVGRVGYFGAVSLPLQPR
jgi:hypothetical protein